MKHDLHKTVDQLRQALETTGVTDAQLLSRFVAERDEAAFAALVRRHGPMVLGACHRILGNLHDTDDAFQATFLVLVQRARSVANHQALASWLYTVACRSAQQAKVRNMRRQRRVRPVERLPEPAVAPAEPQDWQPVFDHELSRLPEKYRTALVLCDLQGLPRRDAARQLNLAEGTLCSRLARGRRMLAARLARHGITLSAGALAVSVAEASAAVPGPLVAATTQSALLLAAGQMSAIAMPVASIIQGVSRSMCLAKLRSMLPILLALVLLGAGTLVYCVGGQDATAPAAQQEANGKVTGRVVLAADGKPVAGADVRLHRRGSDTTARRVTANADGAFTFDRVAPGSYRVWAFHGNLASRSRMYQGDMVTVPADGTAKPVTLKMRPGIVVRVKVLDEKDGMPIAGARVRLTWTDTDRDRTTDARGEVELPALTPETWHIETTAKDRAAVTRIVNLANEQPAALEVRLAPGGGVEGRVAGADGKPLIKVGIAVYRGDDGNPLAYVETDADGRYRIDHLKLRETLKVHAARRDYLPQERQFSVESAGSAARVDVVLKKRPHGGSIHGIVTDADGKPVAGAELFNPGGSSDEVRKAKTDEHGKYRLEDLYERTYFGHQLIVRARGWAPHQLKVQPGPAAQPAEVNIRLVERGHTIKGRVVNAAGEPIRGAWVYVGHGETLHGLYSGDRATTEAQGRFQFDSLPADTPFTIRADGYTQRSNDKLPLDGVKEVVVTLKSAGVIKGRVVDAATGKALGRFNVSITFSPDRGPDDPTDTLTTSRITPGEEFASANGRFVLKDLTAGMPLQVSVRAPGYRRQVLRRVVAQPDAEAAVVDIELKAEDPAKLLTIRGKLVNHKGQPVRGADLRLIAATDRPKERDSYPFTWQMIETGQIERADSVVQVQRLTTGADGTFNFQRVPGDLELELVYWGKGIAPARIDRLDALSVKDLGNMEIAALAPARISGTIDRKVFPEFNSIQLSGNSRFFSATVAADGKSYTFDDLPPGTYEVQVYGPAMRLPNNPGGFTTRVIGRKTVTITGGQRATADLGQAEAVQ